MIQFLTFSKTKAEDKAGFPLKKRDFHYKSGISITKRDFHYKSEISITKAGFPLQKRDFHYKAGFPLQKIKNPKTCNWKFTPTSIKISVLIQLRLLNSTITYTED